MLNNLFNSVNDIGYENGIIGAILGFFAIFFVFFLVFAIFSIIGRWKLYKKAGKQGWECIIPFYGRYVFMVEMAGLKWYWFAIEVGATVLAGILENSTNSSGFSLLTTAATIICNLTVAYNISAKVGKRNDMGNTILLLFLGGIMYPVYGYSKNVVWDQNAPVTENGIFDKDKLNMQNFNVNSNVNNNFNTQQNTTYQNNFDPNTGEPVNNSVKPEYNFDPNTGERINKEEE